MAELAIASNTLELAGQIGNYLKVYRKSWNQTSKAISDFERLHHQLATEKAEWEQMLNDYGLTNDQGLRTRFETASKHLDEERQRFSHLQTDCCLSFWTKAEASPEILTDSIDSLIHDFEQIPNFLRAREDMTRMLASRANDTPDSLGFGFDPRIVRLEEIEAKVMKELTPEANNKVVNLYGEPGSGKTCLAKSIAYQIHDAANNMRSSKSSSTHTSINENNTMFEDGAVFLTCDPEAKDCGKLCGEILGKIRAPGQDACVDKELPEKLRAMRNRLLTKHVLIVFDNVMNLEQIKGLLVLEATGVKYLVTSRSKEVWPEAKCVLMDKPTMSEAYKILARRAKMPNDEIPDNLEDLVDELIDRVGCNLLALALILKTMKDPLQEEYWELALEDFNSIADDASFVHTRRVEAFGEPYPHTLSVAMLMALEGLHDKARDLLYLVALFGGHGVPEPLLGLAFRASHPNLLPGDFVRARDELEELDLIQLECPIDPIDHFTWRTCVLNPTRRLLIRKKKQGEVSAKLVALLNNSAFKERNKDIDALLAVLCLFYILQLSGTHADENEFLTEEAAKKMEEARKVLKLKPFTEESGWLYSELISDIEPLIHLLHFSKKGEGWKLECQESARKVIMKYIQKGHVDDKIVSQLLQVHQTFLGTCHFLRNILWHANPSTIVFEEEIEGESNEKKKVFLQTPVVLIGKYMDLLHSDDSNLQLLRNIKFTISQTIDKRNWDYVLEHTSLLEKIHNMMLLEVGHNLKWGLALLGLFKSSTAKKIIANYPRVLESLINEVYNSTSDDIGGCNIDIVCLLCGLAEITTVAMKLITSPSNFIPKLLELISLQLSTDVDLDKFLNYRYFRELLNLVGMLSRVVSQIDDNMTRSVFASAPEILERVLERVLLGTNVFFTKIEQKSTIKALTLIDHIKGNGFTINLTSPDLFEARGEANLILGLHKEALADFEASFNYCENNKSRQPTYMLRCVFCKAKLEDYKGALHDADNVVTNFEKSTFTLQERGVVKEMMGDYEGAIEDLTKALTCKGGPDYECLKHRAYARFKLGLEIEAHQDAEMANQLGVPDYVEKNMVRGTMFLGILPVPEFLGYKLT
ncbi:hypothetical protein CY35_04G048400 [Sphagnum magellanicum]|nr:hypothetical protein CY35_04G048400 [Sphagnum magellanicum]KAH9564887.1 hypothetical protein CY35_04G048400 [Sphagnum magellanicum]KAH9564888.1 hypothetical protein CY35_04G048400 [Sphagnum magellanicum]KAH9564889.1 hypothetical protein CY35_04G048400 [Sphagnum magellanicum]KAH9564890.1 hypothetical protein CY35_04G048400 [Sphagnum magellanicum]